MTEKLVEDTNMCRDIYAMLTYMGKTIVMEDRTEIPIDDIYDLNIDQNGDVYLHE